MTEESNNEVGLTAEILDPKIIIKHLNDSKGKFALNTDQLIDW